MKTTPEQDAILANIAAVISGLQAPMSIGGPRMLGAAYQPLVELRNQLRLFGYPNAAESEQALRKHILP